MKHFRLFTAALALLIGVGGFAILPATASAASPKSVVCQTLQSNAGCTSTPSGGVDLNSVIAAIVNVICILAGIAAVIMIIVSGLRLITANGDSNSIASARTGIIYSLIGLLVVAFAQFIVYFVLHHAIYGR